MRRDLHRWFLISIIFTTGIAFLLWMMWGNSEAMAGVVLYLAVFVSCVSYRRRAWRRVYRDENFRSRELRCRFPKDFRVSFS